VLSELQEVLKEMMLVLVQQPNLYPQQIAKDPSQPVGLLDRGIQIVLIMGCAALTDAPIRVGTSQNLKVLLPHNL